MKQGRWRRWEAMLIAIWLCALSQSNAQNVTNGSFETPVLAPDSFFYNPSGATWVFTADSGIISAPGAGFFGPAAPDGSQYAFLQSANSPGAFSQSINFTLAGTYQLSYLVAGRSDAGGPAGDLSYEILLDSTVIATDMTNTAQPFTARLSQFTTTAGSHTLSFQVAPRSTGDNTAFFDRVAIQVPEPGTILLLLTFAPMMPLARKISRRN
jgi:hypothetical protein